MAGASFKNIQGNAMNKKIMTLSFALIAAGCAPVKLISDYDPVIDKGVTEFAEQFNAHLKNMSDLSGTPDGTYDANLKTYNALDAKIDVLINRATAAADGKACKLEQKVFDKVQSLLKDNMPVVFQSGQASPQANASGCDEKLLVLVKQQLELVETIHKDTDKCGDKKLSCLRPATVKSAQAIANQSINAVAIVEAAKKPLQGK